MVTDCPGSVSAAELGLWRQPEDIRRKKHNCQILVNQSNYTISRNCSKIGRCVAHRILLYRRAAGFEQGRLKLRNEDSNVGDRKHDERTDDLLTFSTTGSDKV
jgi:hypothetical protein